MKKNVWLIGVLVLILCTVGLHWEYTAQNRENSYIYTEASANFNLSASRIIQTEGINFSTSYVSGQYHPLHPLAYDIGGELHNFFTRNLTHLLIIEYNNTNDQLFIKHSLQLSDTDMGSNHSFATVDDYNGDGWNEFMFIHSSNNLTIWSFNQTDMYIVKSSHELDDELSFATEDPIGSYFCYADACYVMYAERSGPEDVNISKWNLTSDVWTHGVIHSGPAWFYQSNNQDNTILYDINGNGVPEVFSFIDPSGTGLSRTAIVVGSLENLSSYGTEWGNEVGYAELNFADAFGSGGAFNNNVNGYMTLFEGDGDTYKEIYLSLQETADDLQDAMWLASVNSENGSVNWVADIINVSAGDTRVYISNPLVGKFIENYDVNVVCAVYSYNNADDPGYYWSGYTCVDADDGDLVLNSSSRMFNSTSSDFQNRNVWGWTDSSSSLWGYSPKNKNNTGRIAGADMDQDGFLEIVNSAGVIDFEDLGGGIFGVGTNYFNFSDIPGYELINNFIPLIIDIDNSGFNDVCANGISGMYCTYGGLSNINNNAVVNNTYKYGGYGVNIDFTSPICLDTTLTFTAQENVNYNNDFSADTERISSNCGMDDNGNSVGTNFNQYLQNGTFNNNNPQFSCLFNKTGTYQLRLYLQDDINSNDYSSFNTQTIPVIVMDGIPGSTCNLATGWTVGESGVVAGGVSSDDVVDIDTSVQNSLGILLGSESTGLKLIVALGIVLAIIVGVAQRTKSPYAISIGALSGFIICTALGLISVYLLILLILGMIGYFFLMKYILGGTGDGGV